MEKVVWTQVLIGAIYFSIIAVFTTYFGIREFRNKDI